MEVDSWEIILKLAMFQAMSTYQSVLQLGTRVIFSRIKTSDAICSDKSSWFKPSISWKEQNRIWGMLQRYVQTALEVYNVYVDFAIV